jgi:cellobiose-specific phosphotransferase system component IIB
MVVNKMKHAAMQKGIATEFIAVATVAFDSSFQKNDCCLLEPHINYH